MLPWAPTEYTKPNETVRGGGLGVNQTLTYRPIWIGDARGRGHGDAGNTQVCGAGRDAGMVRVV